MTDVAWREAYDRQQRRAATDRAIVGIKRLRPNVRAFLHWLNRIADDNGAVFAGADHIAADLDYSPTWIYALFKLACQTPYLHLAKQGGGCHRTSVYMLTIGHWRPDDGSPTFQNDWSERIRAIYNAADRWLGQLFIDHRESRCCDADCWRFAPSWVKQEYLRLLE